MNTKTPREIKAIVRKAGCKQIKQAKNGGHEKWFSPITKRRFSIPRGSKPVTPDTLHDIEIESGVKLH